MFSFKENPVYTNSVILIIKFRKDVPGIVFSIQVLNETEKNSVLSSIKKNGTRKFHVAVKCWKRSEQNSVFGVQSRCFCLFNLLLFLKFLLLSTS